MKKPSIFWMVDYIKANRDFRSRYTIDLYLLRQGYAPDEIEDAWQIAGLNLNHKRPPFIKYLFVATLLCNFLGWYCVNLPWQSAVDALVHPFTTWVTGSELNKVAVLGDVNAMFYFLPLTLWTFSSIFSVGYFFSNPQLFPHVLKFNLVCILVCLGYDILLISKTLNNLDWTGPIGLTLVLIVGLVCTFLEWKYIPKKIEIVLTH